MDSDESLKVLQPEDELRAEGKKEWSDSSARVDGKRCSSTLSPVTELQLKTRKV